MKLKYKIKQRADGLWYVYSNKNTYWTKSFSDPIEATKDSLLKEGSLLVEKLDDVQKRMESIPGFIDRTDPYGWRA